MAGEKPFMLELQDYSTRTMLIPNDKVESLQELSKRTLDELQQAGGSIFLVSSDEEEKEDNEEEEGSKREVHILSLSEAGNQKYTLRTSKWVGFISYKGTPITIRSRFAEKTGNDFFLHYLMYKVLQVPIYYLSAPASDCESIIDLLVLLFPSYLTRAVSQGVFKQYQRFHYNDYRPKGTIDVARHIKCNVPFRGKIAYNTREQTYDNPVTQLVRHTIEVIRNKPGYDCVLNLSPEVASRL